MKNNVKDNFSRAYMPIEAIIEGEKAGKHNCPFPVDVIPNMMGINLCSVRGISWTETIDGQLVDIKIHFIPAEDGSHNGVMLRTIKEVVDKKTGEVLQRWDKDEHGEGFTVPDIPEE